MILTAYSATNTQKHISVLNYESNISQDVKISQTNELNVLKGSKIPKVTIIRDNRDFIFSVNEYSKERYKLDRLIIEYPKKDEVIKLDNLISSKDVTKAINDSRDPRCLIFIKI